MINSHSNTGTTEQHVHYPEILTSADLLKLISFMGDYESTLCRVLENSKHNVLGSLNIDAYEMEGDYHNLIERYVKITRPKIEEFFDRICNNMLQSQLISAASSKSLDGVSLFNENEFGQMYTLAPVDMLNVRVCVCVCVYLIIMPLDTININNNRSHMNTSR